MHESGSTSESKSRPLKVAMIVADEREALARYELPEPYFGSAPSALLAGLKETPGVEVHIISCVRQPVREPGKLAENIYYHALRVSKWGFLRTVYLPCILKIRKKLRQLQPDVAHGQGSERYYALAAAYSGFPNLITIHGNMRRLADMNHSKPFSFHWLTARLEALAIHRTWGVVCISQHTQELVRNLARRTWIMPNAVDSSFFDVERRPDSKPLVLCIANIAPHKNQNEFIRALDPLAARLNFKLVFLGNAVRGRTYDDEFFRLVESRPWCAHEGFANREKLKIWLSRAAMMVLPSLEDNCPMAVLEAMAAGVPVLAGHIGGLPDLIEDEVSGFFCNPLSHDSMRDGVEKVLTDLSRARVIADMAKQRAKEQFDPKIIAKRHMEIYSTICSTAA